MGGSSSRQASPEPVDNNTTSKVKKDKPVPHKEEEEDQEVKDTPQEPHPQPDAPPGDNFMNGDAPGGKGANSASSSTLSIPDLADDHTPVTVENPDYAPSTVFIDREKGKPLFTKNSPPSSVASGTVGKDKGEVDANENSNEGWTYTKEDDIDQMSVTNEDYL